MEDADMPINEPTKRSSFSFTSFLLSALLIIVCVSYTFLGVRYFDFQNAKNQYKIEIARLIDQNGQLSRALSEENQGLKDDYKRLSGEIQNPVMYQATTPASETVPAMQDEPKSERLKASEKELSHKKNKS